MKPDVAEEGHAEPLRLGAGARHAQGMALVLDPSILMGSRSEQWLARAASQNVLRRLVAPAASATPELDAGPILGSPGFWRGWFPRALPHPDFVAQMQHIRFDARLHPVLPRPRPDAAHQQLALDVWAALVEGHTLVARRTDVLDRLVQCGVALEVIALHGECSAEAAWRAASCDLPSDLVEALRRRTRLLARCDHGEARAGQPRIAVWDDGPYRAGRWR